MKTEKKQEKLRKVLRKTKIPETISADNAYKNRLKLDWENEHIAVPSFTGLNTLLISQLKK